MSVCAEQMNTCWCFVNEEKHLRHQRYQNVQSWCPHSVTVVLKPSRSTTEPQPAQPTEMLAQMMAKIMARESRRSQRQCFTTSGRSYGASLSPGQKYWRTWELLGYPLRPAS